MPQSAYHVAYQIRSDYDLHVRVAASAQQEYGATSGDQFDPELWATAHSWEYAAQTDWIAAVMSAIDNGLTSWGADPAVVTDQHILSFVQSAGA